MPVWVQRSSFHAPASSAVPLLLVGPGTGLAPFRAFLQDRQVLLATGAHVFPYPGDFVQMVHWQASKLRFRERSLMETAGVGSTGGSQGPVHLFFGCRNAEGDVLYREELEAFLATGVLAGLHIACSRDQLKKVYVTHLIRQQAVLVWRLLQQVR